MRLLWLDLETSGLDPSKDCILEIAAATADLFDPFNVHVITESVLWFHPELVKNQNKHVIDMHTKNGLWKDCADEARALDAFEVEDELLKHVPLVDDKDERPTLAGSSVHFDRSFIATWMPRLHKRLSHRLYDVSAIKLFCESLGMPRIPKAETHRALADVRESIAHAQACQRWLQERFK